MREKFSLETDKGDKGVYVEQDRKIKTRWYIETSTFDKKTKIPFNGTFEQAREKAIKLLN